MASSKSRASKIAFGDGTFVEVETVWGNETLKRFAAMDQIENMADRWAERDKQTAKREAQLIKFDAWRARSKS